VGTKGGAESHPAWYLNILAESSILVRVGAETYGARATVIGPEERAEVWPLLTSWQPILATFERTCAGEIPAVRLTRVDDQKPEA
jgi:hypothetical protein